MTALSIRLSRMRRDCTWWRWSLSALIALGGSRFRSICRDDGANVFAVEGAGEVAWFEAVDDVNRAAMLSGFHQFKHGALHHQVLQIHRFQLRHGDFGN